MAVLVGQPRLHTPGQFKTVNLPVEIFNCLGYSIADDGRLLSRNLIVRG
jgi:hypothetical protein